VVQYSLLGAVLSRALYKTFPSPKSFSGQELSPYKMFPCAGACAGGGNTPGKKVRGTGSICSAGESKVSQYDAICKTFHGGIKMAANYREGGSCFSLKDWIYLNLILKGLDLSEDRYKYKVSVGRTELESFNPCGATSTSTKVLLKSHKLVWGLYRRVPIIWLHSPKNLCSRNGF